MQRIASRVDQRKPAWRISGPPAICPTASNCEMSEMTVARSSARHGRVSCSAPTPEDFDGAGLQVFVGAVAIGQ